MLSELSLRAKRSNLLILSGIASLTLAMTACTSNLFDPIENNTSSPVSVTVDVTNSRAYLVNSNHRLKYEDASLMVLDITDPTAPTLVSTVGIPNFSGQSYLDATNRQLYITNRVSDNRNDLVDRLLQADVSSDTATVTEFSSGDNPNAIACCDSSSRFFVTSYGGEFLRYAVDDLAASTSISFDVTLSTGEPILGIGASGIAIIGAQAFVSTRAGEIFVINLDELGGTSNPVDHVIFGDDDLRGIATNGTLLYVVKATVAEEAVLVIDPSTLTASDATDTSEHAIADVTNTTIALTEDDKPNEIIYYAALDQLYVSKTGVDTVDVIDPTTETVTATFTLNVGTLTADEPFGLTAFNDGTTDYLYVSNLRSDNVSIINLTTSAVVATYP